MTTPGRRPGAIIGPVAVVAGLLAVTACASSQPPAAPAPEVRLDGSVVQLRFEEGTPTLHLHVHNRAGEPVEVSSVRLDGPALTTPEATPVVAEASVVEPGGLLTAPTRHGDPDCGAPDEPPTLAVTLADGTTREVPLDAEGAGLVDRLVASLCGRTLLREAAQVRWLPTWRVGEEAATGVLAVDRVEGAAPVPLEVVGMRGTVLLDLAPGVAGASDRWHTQDPATFTLPPDRRRARLPVRLVSNGRCDPHALSQSSQTFLLSVFVQLEGQPEQRLVLVPDRSAQDRILELVRRSCGQ